MISTLNLQQEFGNINYAEDERLEILCNCDAKITFSPYFCKHVPRRCQNVKELFSSNLEKSKKDAEIPLCHCS